MASALVRKTGGRSDSRSKLRSHALWRVPSHVGCALSAPHLARYQKFSKRHCSPSFGLQEGARAKPLSRCYVGIGSLRPPKQVAVFKSWRLGVSIPRPLRTYSIVTRVASTEALSVRALAFCGAFLSCLALAQAREYLCRNHPQLVGKYWWAQ